LGFINQIGQGDVYDPLVAVPQNTVIAETHRLITEQPSFTRLLVNWAQSLEAYNAWEEAAFNDFIREVRRESIKKFNKRKKQRRAYCGGRKS
jgi:hypothetical protein